MASGDFSSGAQAQLKREDQASNPSNQSSGPQDQSYTTQASNFLQQTGEQVKNMAQGAAEAVKSTLGMNADDEGSHGQARSHPPLGGGPTIANNPTDSTHRPRSASAASTHDASHQLGSAGPTSADNPTTGLGSTNNPSNQPPSTGLGSTNNPSNNQAGSNLSHTI